MNPQPWIRLDPVQCQSKAHFHARFEKDRNREQIERLGFESTLVPELRNCPLMGFVVP